MKNPTLIIATLLLTFASVTINAQNYTKDTYSKFQSVLYSDVKDLNLDSIRKKVKENNFKSLEKYYHRKDKRGESYVSQTIIAIQIDLNTTIEIEFYHGVKTRVEIYELINKEAYVKETLSKENAKSTTVNYKVYGYGNDAKAKDSHLIFRYFGENRFKTNGYDTRMAQFNVVSRKTKILYSQKLRDRRRFGEHQRYIIMNTDNKDVIKVTSLGYKHLI
tara:strand:- start:307 stop:963 length:657 start_codon:yes stop_codon:yes gene_type:complete